MAASSLMFSQLLAKFDDLKSNLDVFLRPQNKLADDLKEFTKQLYDLSKSTEIVSIPASVALPELIIQDFDDEQIWQELELQNNAYNGHFIRAVSKLLNCNKKGREAVTFLDQQRSGRDNDAEELSESSSNEHPEPDGGDSGDEDFEKLKTISLLDNDDDDDDAMSDISIELEKALDQRIALDKENGNLSDANEADGNDDEENEDQENLESDARKERKHETPKFRTTVVDDKFFKLSQLEQFLEKEDAKEERRIRKLESSTGNDDEDDDEFDYFQDVPSSEGSDGDEEDQQKHKTKSGRKVKYADFFDPPDGEPKGYGKRRMTSDEEDDEEDENEDDENVEQSDSLSSGDEESQEMPKVKSTFEVRQEKLKEKIGALEESNLSEKPWQLMGEASVAVRPENSLLEEHLQFDHMTRQAPVITEETTSKVEDIIIQRIKDQSWDDVERKIKPKEQPFEYKKRLVLDQEKSKLSLAEVYAEEYLKQQKGEKTEEEEEPEEHKEIRKTMAQLFTKLDALSNFHFIPKPLAPELKIVNNLPAIVVEEVAPVSASDAALLAPEEIKEKGKGELMGKTERTATDTKRERREKKSGQRKRKQRKEAHKKIVDALNPGLGNKYSKEAALKELQREGKVTLTDKDAKSSKKSSLTSSKNFFAQLQEEVQTSIQQRKTQLKQKKTEKQASAVKLKL